MDLLRILQIQPVSYFGRSPLPPQSSPRYTLDELLRDIAEQSDSLFETV